MNGSLDIGANGAEGAAAGATIGWKRGKIGWPLRFTGRAEIRHFPVPEASHIDHVVLRTEHIIVLNTARQCRRRDFPAHAQLIRNRIDEGARRRAAT